MRWWLIKKLGGYTEQEMQTAISKAQKAASVNAEKQVRSKIKRSYSWLKSEIHRKLDLMFPGKEFSKARFRWLHDHATVSHISMMDYEELKRVNDLLGDI